MSRFLITPQYGSRDQSKNVSFKIDGLVNANGLRIKLENATCKTNVIVDGIKENYIEVEKGKTFLEGVVDLNMAEPCSQSMITIFANIAEEIEDGSFKVVEISPSAYHIQPKKIISFSRSLELTNPFLNKNEICGIKIDTENNKRFIFSINDRRFSIITN